jgi:hypothetical protein
MFDTHETTTGRFRGRRQQLDVQHHAHDKEAGQEQDAAKSKSSDRDPKHMTRHLNNRTRTFTYSFCRFCSWECYSIPPATRSVAE